MLAPGNTREKEDANVVCMSQVIVGRTMEGAIVCVCKVLALLPAGIGIMQM